LELEDLSKFPTALKVLNDYLISIIMISYGIQLFQYNEAKAIFKKRNMS
jgi:uncharacterized protein (DUF486 family)